MMIFEPFNFTLDLMVRGGQAHILEMGYIRYKKNDFNLEYRMAYGRNILDDVFNFARSVDPYRNQEFSIVNTNARMCTVSKSAFYTLFYDVCTEIFPKTRIYPASTMDALHAAAMEDFEARDVVFKNPITNNGQGVCVVRADEMDTPLAKQQMWAMPAFNYNKHEMGTLAAQEYVHPDAVTVNGLRLSPSLRLFATAYQPSEGKVEIKFHGGHYRLHEMQQTISGPAELDSYFSSLAEGEEIIRPSAPVPQTVLDNVYAQLETYFKPQFEKITKRNPLHLANLMLCHTDPAIPVIGLDFITQLGHRADYEQKDIDAASISAARAACDNPYAHRYLKARIKEPAETWSPMMRDLYMFAKDLDSSFPPKLQEPKTAKVIQFPRGS